MAALVGLPVLWAPSPFTRPSFAGPAARHHRFRPTPGRECDSIARTLMKKRDMNSSVLSVNLVRQPPTVVQACALATCLGHHLRAALQSSICMVMTSSKTNDRARMVQNTWGRLIRTQWMISE